MENFQTELLQIPSLLLNQGLLLAEAKKAEALAKLAKEKTSSELDALARESLGGEKKPTEAAIANWIKIHPSMQNAEQHLVDAGYELDKVRASYETLKAKKDILLAVAGGNDVG